MRLLLLSDIHGNLTALEAVLRHAEKQRWDRVVFLGDLVGYYPEPNEVAAHLADLQPLAALLGNHDSVALDILGGSFMGGSEDDVALDVLKRHAREVNPETFTLLASLTPGAEGDGWQAMHGALRHPWEYIDSLAAAQANLELLEKPLGLVGHTHVPKLFAMVRAGAEKLWRTVAFPQTHTVYRIPPHARVIFNPGSVGQPRDGLPLASYAIYDEAERLIELHRVEFDVAAVQHKVRQAGYPEFLARRLAAGR